MQGFNQLPLGDQDNDVMDISVYDHVLKNPLLLSKIVGFLRCPPAPREKKILLALRLLSTGFNEAVLDSVSSSDEIPVRLTISKNVDESSLSGLDGRLCRDVGMTFCNNTFGYCNGGCTPPHLAPLFNALVAQHGTKIQILKIDHQTGVALGTTLTLVNDGCPNLTQLNINAVVNDQAVISWKDWDGCFAQPMTTLVKLEVSSNLQGEFVERHVTRVVNSLLQVTPNLQKLSIEGDFSLVVPEKVQGLKYLKHSYFCGPPKVFQSFRSVVAMINSVASNLETLEISHFDRRRSQFRLQPPPTLRLNSFPCLKNITLGGLKYTAVSLSLWEHILEGGAGCLETVDVQWINYTDDQYHFWVPLRVFPVPLTMVTKLSLYGDLDDSSSQSERLGQISAAFPNLSEFVYSIGSGEENTGAVIEQVVVGEIFQMLMVGWVKPIKKVEIYINRGCSIHVVTAVLEAIGQDFFRNGLETLRITAWRPYDQEDLEAFTSEQQLDRLTQVLLWTRNMESVKFRTFRIPANVGGRLRDFISSNGLPVSFDRYEDEE